MARSTKQTKSSQKLVQRHKKLVWGLGILATLLIAVFLAFRLSPWPGVMIIRPVFDKGAATTKQALQKFTPSGVSKISDQQYMASSKNALLDVYYPTDQVAADKRLPTIIWTHGGAWLSGDKANVEPYFRLIASKGYVVIALNYSLAPGRTYPTQITELNQAHSYIGEQAERFYVDTNNIFLAGDSAGSQLSAQLAAIATNPAYAQEVGMTPSLQPSQLKGVILNCGIYKMEALASPDPTLPKLIGWGDDVTVWSYAGTHDFNSPVIRQMSPYYHVTKDFPATFITGGNADPLTNVQSKPLAEKLQSLGVSTTPLFYADNHQPALPHEYQFNLDTTDGQKSLEAILTFIRSRVQ